MKKGKHNKNKDDGRAIDDVEEVIDPAAEKSLSKKKLVIGVATGVAALTVGVDIGLLVSGRLDLHAVLPSSTAKGVKSIADGAAKAIVQAPALPVVEAVAADPKVVDVDWFIRKLPESWHASRGAVLYAASVGVDLAEGQTIVRPQTRLYSRAA